MHTLLKTCVTRLPIVDLNPNNEHAKLYKPLNLSFQGDVPLPAM